MNWEAIGAIGEVAGAIGVILTLAYLAVQIRQNTRQMERSERAARGAAYQDVLSNLQTFLTPIGADGELAEIIRRGLVDLSQLSESEFFRFNWLLGGYMTNLDNVYYQYCDGVVSEARWQMMLSGLRYFIRAPGFYSWWTDWDDSTVGPEFAAAIHKEVQAIWGDSEKPQTDSLAVHLSHKLD